MNKKPTYNSIEQGNKSKWIMEESYSTNNIIPKYNPNEKDYFKVFAICRRNILHKYSNKGKILDICCATGIHLFDIANNFKIEEGFGLDYTKIYIDKATIYSKENNYSNIFFNEGDARKLPYNDNYFNSCYCFSALYAIPEFEKAISEMSRVLVNEGICIFDLGNKYSINNYVAKSHEEAISPFHISVDQMKKIIRDNNLTIKEHIAFQILPYWGNKPKWLKLFLLPFWKKIMQCQIKGKMLDERISNLPIIKYFAFRHIFICEKNIEV